MDVNAPVLPSTTVHAPEPAAPGTPTRALPLKGRGPSGLDPFLALEHVAPLTLGPAATARALATGPRKGFEQVTLVYRGDLRHRDSAGNAGVLDVGDVLWVTAGNGVVSELAPGPSLDRDGGILETVGLRVNLPTREKTAAPHVRALRAGTFPLIPLTQAGANYVRLVAGVWEGYTGPAHTYTPLTVADVYLEAGIETTIALDASWHTGVYLLDGGVSANGEGLDRHGLATVRDEAEVRIQAFAASHVLFVSGLPVAEPIAATADLNFVLNTEEEVRLAEREYRDGLYGTLK